ncbi:putative Non-specific protein-tyrosine kinase [Gigaspora margarita]|uniref:Putative Non-specific protein-tyrosine kinase n=1 Tax=Gigaspora margarita TaxID=4874 RepID=A0A8H4A680_GIGMA|nr:putative Non-specific protein-tyrosine kinase [Gigaspora margarita]
MNHDQNKRPTATVIGNRIGYWLDEMSQDDDSEIKKQFLEADKIKLNVESPKHPNHVYTSKSINIQEITNKLSVLDLHEISEDDDEL